MNSIEKKYRYTWRGRHRGVYFMIWFWACFSAFTFASALLVHNLNLNEIRYDGFLYVLIGAIIYGIYSDYASRNTAQRIYHTVIIRTDALIIHVSEQEQAAIPWSSIIKIDDFDIRDMRPPDPERKESDFWAARGIGGIRITTNDHKVYRIYRTLEHFKEVRKEIIHRAQNAMLLKNGTPRK